MNPQVRISREAIAGFCRAHAVRELALFGSATRADYRADSDIDVLINLKHEARVGLVALQRMREELEAILGRPVDLLTQDGLNRHIREEVLSQAEIVYAE